ncbi:MAG: DUF3465 domain-containing protein [Cyanobacteriota bacterium]
MNKLLKMFFVSILLFSTSCSNQQVLTDLSVNQDISVAQKTKKTIIQLTQQPQNIVEHGVYFGTVTEKLPDDNDGLKHEVFMIKMTQGKYKEKIVKVAHDTSYAPYIEELKAGDNLEIKGDLIINATPEMVLHWTHKSDNPKHPSGYIKLNGKVYE